MIPLRNLKPLVKAKFAQKKARRTADKLAQAPMLNASAQHTVSNGRTGLKQGSGGVESSPGKRAREVGRGEDIEKQSNEQKQKKITKRRRHDGNSLILRSEPASLSG